MMKWEANRNHMIHLEGKIVEPCLDEMDQVGDRLCWWGVIDAYAEDGSTLLL